MFSKTYLFLIILLVSIFVVHALALGGFLGYNLWWLDNALHFLGGIWLASLGWWYLFEHKNHQLNLPFWILALGVISFTVFGGVLWEFYEFAWDYFIARPYGVGIAQPSLGDTMSDLFFDLAGALVAALCFLYYYRFGRDRTLKDQRPH